MGKFRQIDVFRVIDIFRLFDTFREKIIFLLENVNAAVESGEKNDRISSTLYVLISYLTVLLLTLPISLVLLKHNQLKCSRLS